MNDKSNTGGIGSGTGYFDPNREIDKYDLDDSTFDLIDLNKFRNTRFLTVFAYLVTWFFMILSWVLLGVDIYTCLNILVFHHWSTDDYQPYAYSIAKWIFTGCIIFQFVLLAYHWIWGIHTYKTKNIALTYVNSIARLLRIVKSYGYHCLFHEIEQDNFFDWSCFLAYSELDHALQILVADTPRQVINILTLRYYATDGESLNDIIANIKNIATSNVRLSIILSFMCVSVVIWSIFFFKFALAMIILVPIMFKLREKGYKSLKKYCCDVVNEDVRLLVRKNHKSKRTLLETGVLDLKDIAANPLLSSSTTTFHDFDVKATPFRTTSVSKPLATHKIHPSYRYNSFKHGFDDYSNPTYESLPLDDLNPSTDHLHIQPTIPTTFAFNFINESKQSLAGRFTDPRENSAFARSDSYTTNSPSRDGSTSDLLSANATNPFDDTFDLEGKLEAKTRTFSQSYDSDDSGQNLYRSLSTEKPLVPKIDESSTEIEAKQDLFASPGDDLPNPFEDQHSIVPEPSLSVTELSIQVPQPSAPYPVRGVSMYHSDSKEDLQDSLRKNQDTPSNP